MLRRNLNQTLLTLASLALGLAVAGPGRAAMTAPVRIDSGALQGAPGSDPSVTVFKGIPYAAPPVGPLRWRPPAPAEAWKGVHMADSFGSACPQPTGQAALKANEDCLNLNVWTAAKSRTERRPVLVWMPIFLGGSASSPDFSGEGLARKGVIVVTVNYRVGPLGFLAAPELSKESGHGASGNYGLMDQIAALKWVKRNIKAFGGDSSRVTLAGTDSQRGSVVNALAVSPLAKGLFQRAMSQSQFPIPSVLDPPRQGPMSNALAAAETQGAEYMRARGAHSMADLRALPLDRLLKGPDAGGLAEAGGGPRRAYEPIVDGWVVPVWYNDPTAGAHRPNVPYLVGNNLNEGGARPEAEAAQTRAQGADPRGRAEPKLTIAAYTAWAGQKFGARAEEFLKLYPAATDDEAVHENNVIVQDYARIATYLWGLQWTKGSSKPMFTYFWTHPSPGRPGEIPSAGHGSEVIYAFDNLEPGARPWTDQDRKIASVMSSYWANIAKTGNPNGPGLPVWPALNAKAPKVMELGDHMGAIPLASPEKVAFWQAVYRESLAAKPAP